jgi:serine/threonine protein kinase/WD40 repeat protein
MPIAEAHPSAQELAAFTLGTLDDEVEASIETHVAACTSCQERAAVAPGDSLVELLRRVDARADRGADTFVEAAAHVQTPVPLAAVAETEGLAPAVALFLSAGSGRPTISDPVPPELAGHERYHVLRLIGAGVMGAVYEAEHRVMRRRVAVKVIKRDYTANAGALERFRREVENAPRLSHPNIVITYDAEDAGDTHFLVMEYVEGTDLGRLVQEHGPLAVDRACDYVRQAALGLQYAFEQGMVHRDLKPHNLMLSVVSGGAVSSDKSDPAGPTKHQTPNTKHQIQILDFGLARFATEAATKAGATASGIVLGTVDYIAPEQADNAHQADIRSDIYSLGCTLYHLLAGQPPFPTGTPIQKVMAHVKKKPQPLTELRNDLPEGLMPVLERMMAKKPKHRYQTPIEVANALEWFTFARATVDVDRTVVLDNTAVRRRRQRRFLIATAILSFLAAGLLGVGVYRIATDRGELVISTESDDVKVVITKRGELVDIIDPKTDKQIRLALRSGEYELELKGAHEGLKLDIEKATLKRGKETLAKIERIGKNPPEPVGEVRQFVGHTGSVRAVAYSPCGRYALTAGGWPNPDGTLRLWDLGKGKEVWSRQAVFRWAGGECNIVVFSPDGRRAVTRGPAGPDGSMKLWEVETGKELRSWNDDREHVQGLAFLPDGKHILSGGNSGWLQLWDLDTEKEVIAIQDTGRPIVSVAVSPDGSRAITGSYTDKLRRLWDLKTGMELRRFQAPEGYIPRVAFSPSGRDILTGGTDGKVRLWDAETGKEIRQFIGHSDGVVSVAFSPDGKRALSGGGDGTIRLWEVATGKELHRFEDFWAPSYNGQRHVFAAFSPDGHYAFSGGGDGIGRLWRLPDPPPAKENP